MSAGIARLLFCGWLFCLGSCAQADEAAFAEPLFSAILWDVHDQPAALESYRGKPLVVNFWARWCAPCRQEIPELIKVHAALGGKIAVIGIAIDDQAGSVRDFAKAYDMDYPLFLAKDHGIPLLQALGNDKTGLPFTVWIDRRGNIVGSKLGVIQKDELQKAVDRIRLP